MVSVHIGNSSKSRLFIGSFKIKKGYLGNTRVYSSGNIVTYHVDSGITYQEEVDYENSCLSPTTFTPVVAGYEFVGWRTDSQASGNVLSYKNMGDDPIELYAVFKRTVILTLYNNSSLATVLAGNYYYNNGRHMAPRFTQNAADRAGWEFKGWSTSPNTDGAISYVSISDTAFSSPATLYGIYSRKIKLFYCIDAEYYESHRDEHGNVNYVEGKCTYQEGICIYNSSGSALNATITVKKNMFTRDGYIFDKWIKAKLNAGENDMYYKPGDKIVMDGTTGFMTVIGVWEAATWQNTPGTYTFITGEKRGEDTNPHGRQPLITTENGEQKRFYGNTALTDHVWRNIYIPYGMESVAKYTHVDNGSTVYTDDTLPEDKMLLKWTRSGYSDGGVGSRTAGSLSVVEFYANRIGVNYDSLHFTFDHIPRKGNTKAKIWVDYMENHGEAEPTVCGTVIKGASVITVDLDCTKDTTSIDFFIQDTSGDEGLRTILRISRIDLIP